MSSPTVSIQIVVKNGERYIRQCLDSVRAQSYPALEVVIFDNASDDATAEIIKREYPQFQYIRHPVNLGMWPGQELLLTKTTGPYVFALSVDVVLDPDCVAQAVQAFENDRTISAVQPKIYQYKERLIDTCGFTLTHGRKVINIGHGEEDSPRFSVSRQIFGVEGAAPFFRRSALEACRVDGVLIDPDYFWYGDDLDLAWRMTLFGHKQMFIPTAIAWHDRSTTKGVASTLKEHVSRLAIRRQIPIKKRRLDWANVRFTIIKNDYIMNLLRDIVYIGVRELAVLGYTIICEPRVLLEAGRFFRLLPRMLARRRRVMQKAVVSAHAIHEYFI